MQLKIVIDFDGVLFNSALEAFAVCQRCTAGQPGYRQDVTQDEFLAFRAHLIDAWQFNRLYDEARLVRPFERLPEVTAEPEDRAFAERFYAARAEMMQDPRWPERMAPYDFFFRLKPLIAVAPRDFAILSTRDVPSLRRTLDYFDVDVPEIFGQADVRREGSKLAVAKAQGWLDRERVLVAYLDDMREHLQKFAGHIHLPLHAGWGYDPSDTGLGQGQALDILAGLLKAEGHEV